MQPEGFVQMGIKKDMVCRLLRSLYRLKPAACVWNLKIGFVRSNVDPCLYVDLKRNLYITIWVDDLLNAGKNHQDIFAIIGRICNEGFGTTRTFLGDADLTTSRQHLHQPRQIHSSDPQTIHYRSVTCCCNAIRDGKSPPAKINRLKLKHNSSDTKNVHVSTPTSVLGVADSVRQDSRYNCSWPGCDKSFARPERLKT
jgi:hypothetical protein